MEESSPGTTAGGGPGLAVVPRQVVNDACYCSHIFATALGPKVKHRRTRPYRPQTKRKKSSGSHRTLMVEWAYAQTYLSDADREAAYSARLHFYNHHGPRSGIGGLTPAARVHNVTGTTSAVFA